MHNPQCLTDLVGQTPPLIINRWAKTAGDEPACFLLEGPAGTGKSATAKLLAKALGADDDSWQGGYLDVLPASELTLETCDRLFKHTLRLSFTKWKMVVIEELDGVPSKQVERFLKVHLEKLPKRTCIVATSNDATKLNKALLERFRHFQYSAGPFFAEACNEVLAARWYDETGDTPPVDYESWGDHDGEFSMRQALAKMEDRLALYSLRKEVAV